ncbi:MAG: PDZ domain-containing protein [Anaerolineae bacterium]|nr:PDZ domain-containing protein [Anaerolineae bacterium]
MRLLRFSGLILILALLLSLTPFPARAQGGLGATITPDDDGATITVMSGETVVVELPFDPDSALQWRMIMTRTFEQADITVYDTQPGSPAAAAGLQPGDMITAVDGEAVRFSDDLSEVLEARIDETVTLSVVRDGDPLDVALDIRDIPRPTYVRPYVVELVADMPAVSAGFEIGDAILAVDGVMIGSTEQLIAYITERENVEIVVTVRRGLEKLELPVVPVADPTDGVPRIGVSVSETENLISGLSVGLLNLTWYYGVHPFRGSVPPGELRDILVQQGDPRLLESEDGEGLAVWFFEADEVGETRLTFAYADFNLDEPELDQLLDVLIEVTPYRQEGPSV